MMHFIRLIRPINLIIIALTMYSTAFYFDQLLVANHTAGLLFSFPLFLLVLSTVIIAAAGNIINDYFDVKADRVNRPERLIVGKHIKRRWAIIWHWLFNLLAFVMAIYLSYLFETFWYLFIHLLSINLLWYYSMNLKRTAVFGNITIAFLTGLVPLLVGIFYNQYTDWDSLSNFYPFQLDSIKDFPIYVSIGLGLFAFFINWAREIIKDIEDIKGDKILKAKTFPIRYGISKARFLSFMVLLVPILLSSFFILGVKKDLFASYQDFLPISLAGITLLLVFFLLAKAVEPGQFKRVHFWVKIVMIFGLLLPIYWGIMLLK